MSLDSIYRDGRYYDLEFRNWDGDIVFYSELVGKTPGSVLDLACGTGRITLAIAKLGLPVAGLELIPAMLEQAEKKSEEAKLRISWILGDMRNFSLSQRFDWILLPFNSMQHLHDANEVMAMLRHVKTHLAPHGTFALDVLNPLFSHLTEEFSFRRRGDAFEDPDGKGSISIEISQRFSQSKQQLTTRLYYSRDNQKDFRVEDVIMQCFEPPILDSALNAAGFRIVEKFGSFDRTPFGAKSKHQIVLCK